MVKMRILLTGASGFIGSYLLEKLAELNHDLLNLDIAEKSVEECKARSVQISLMDRVALQKTVQEFNPEIVIHLAAHTNPPSERLSDYKVNYQGTENLVFALNNVVGLKNVVFISTQHVIAPGMSHAEPRVYKPLGVYGESKVLMEELIYKNAKFNFVVLRPTNVWGYGNLILETGIWSTLRKGRYFHSKSANCIRNFGYVENVVWQISEFATNWKDSYKSEIFYVGDENINQYEWLNSFSKAFGHGNLRMIPNVLLIAISKLGDLLEVMKVRFPLNSARYKNMITNNQVPIEKTFAAVGRGPFPLDVAVEKTVKLLAMRAINHDR